MRSFLVCHNEGRPSWAKNEVCEECFVMLSSVWPWLLALAFCNTLNLSAGCFGLVTPLLNWTFNWSYLSCNYMWKVWLFTLRCLPGSVKRCWGTPSSAEVTSLEVVVVGTEQHSLLWPGLFHVFCVAGGLWCRLIWEMGWDAGFSVTE